jgi:hypothetical protein
MIVEPPAVAEVFVEEIPEIGRGVHPEQCLSGILRVEHATDRPEGAGKPVERIRPALGVDYGIVTSVECSIDLLPVHRRKPPSLRSPAATLAHKMVIHTLNG